jgi:hypothetical protein
MALVDHYEVQRRASSSSGIAYSRVFSSSKHSEQDLQSLLEHYRGQVNLSLLLAYGALEHMETDGITSSLRLAVTT